ncbi:MAG TPA: lamin tail domain-containing protein [Solirubrobacterales bacterium]
MRRWVAKHWKAVVLWVLLAIAGAVIALPISHYGDKLFGDGGTPTAKGKPAVRIDAAASLVNPGGDETAAEEYVCLVNVGDSPVDLAGWKLYDSEGVVDELGRLRLPPQGAARVYGTGKAPHWNNSGDTITLRDAEDERVDSESYPARDEGEVSGSCGAPR